MTAAINSIQPQNRCSARPVTISLPVMGWLCSIVRRITTSLSDPNLFALVHTSSQYVECCQGERHGSTTIFSSSTAPARGLQTEVGRPLRVRLERHVRSSQFPARTDAKLGVDMAQMGLDRVRRDKQAAGDLRVGQPISGELGHPPFGMGELVLVLAGSPAPAASHLQLLVGGSF